MTEYYSWEAWVKAGAPEDASIILPVNHRIRGWSRRSWPVRLRFLFLLPVDHKWNAWVRDFTSWLEIVGRYWDAREYRWRWFFDRTHYGMAPCWNQPGKQMWHTWCALTHPFRYLRSRGPRRFRPSCG